MDQGISLKKTRYFRTATLVVAGILAAIILMILVLRPVWTIASDGFGYYEYVRSVAFDKDLNFDNEGQFFADEFNVHEKNFYTVPTQTGYYPNPFPIGTSIFEIPWFLAAHAYHHAAGNPDSSLPGFSPDYAFFINIGNIFYGLLGLYITYLFLRKFTRDNITLAAVVVVLFATPLIYFVVYEAIWAHLLAFLFVSTFIYYWHNNRNTVSLKKFLILGLLLGINFLVRWQNVALAVFLVPEMFELLKQLKLSALRYYAGLVAVFLVTALPQFLVWQLLYGHLIVKPPSNSPLSHLLDPRVFSFLVSPGHGMLVWHPVYIVALVGLIYFAAKNPKVGWLFILFLAIEVYINSAVADWWGGGGGTFGARRMLDYSLIYAMGLACFFGMMAYTRLRSYTVALVMAVLILINISLMAQAARGWLDQINPDNGTPGLAVPSPKNFVLNSKRLAFEFLRIK